MRAWFASVLTVACLLVSTSAFAQSAAWVDARAASSAMNRWDYDSAQEILNRMEAEYGEHAATFAVIGEYQFHMGEYEAAVAAFDRAIELEPSAGQGRVATQRALVLSTIDVTRDFATYVTADGLFEISYDPERDAVLIPWAEATLEDAYYEIGYDLGYWPEPPIRVEIFARSEMLAQVSSLTEEAIETSGTIALCKYNKLMFTSPRATVRGYGWRSTLAHEYVHYVVGHKVGQDLPIWLHEALAKYLEGRWTGTREIVMNPSREDLLSRRIEEDDLVTFDEMHPSMAYLPSAEDATVAYAEVFTITEYIIERRGVGAIRQILERVRDGEELEAAFASTLGEDFEVFEQSWMSYLRARPRVEIPGDFLEQMELRGAESEVNDDETEGLGSVEARDYLHLGELLRARGHTEASVVEYERAEALVGDANPVLQNALARAYLDTARADEALAALESVRQWHPNFYRSHLHVGEALNDLARYEEALRALEMAVGINPYDPAVHEEFATAFDALGFDEEASAARERARIVVR